MTNRTSSELENSPTTLSQPQSGVAHDRLLRWPQVREITGISRTTAWRLERQQLFPKRVQVSTRITAWRESEILNFVESRA